MKRNLKAMSLVLSAAALCGCSVKAPEPYGALPVPAQVEWQRMETNMFLHFGPNTFTNMEWGDGTESEDIFNPTAMDCRQWASIAKAAGMKGMIITAKHHDGFCLWPNPVSKHTVAQSKWKDGKGDVLKELSEACREYGLKFGVYISPWDRNDPHYGTPEYNEIFRQTLEHALTSYGPVFEQWFDGACGEGPNGKVQVYDWPMFNGEVYKHHPDATIFSDVGPGCRWVGNEYGSAGRTCWSALDTEEFSPGHVGSLDTLNCGNVHGSHWIPAETDVSIRPGWFYRDSENDKVKSVDELLRIWYESVGRNSLLLLNVPPDRRGLICGVDSLRLIEFRAALDEIQAVDYAEGASVQASSERGGCFRAENLLDDDYDSYWAVGDDELTPSVTLTFDSPRTFNRVMIQEYIPLGQRVADFTIDAQDENGVWKEIARETTIGHKRIVLTDMVTAVAVRINILKSYACPVLNKVALYRDDIMGVRKAETSDGDIVPVSEARVFDAGKVMKASGFFYAPVLHGKGGCVVTYNLDSSVDGKNWTAIYTDKMFDNIVNNPVRQEIEFDNKIELRYIRMTPVRTNESDTYGVSAFGVLE